MTKQPLISVVIPVYNAQDSIGETITSILGQSHTHIEIIVVNDYCTDQTLEKIAAFDHPAIRVVLNPEKSGVSGARNHGMLHATGEYICFFDADDLMAPEFLSARIGFLEKNRSYMGACGKVIKKNQATGELGTEKFEGISTNPIRNIIFFNRKSITCPSNFVFQRNWLEGSQVKFNPLLSSSADRFFLLEVSLWGSIFEVSTSGSELIYMVRSNSMSHLLTDALLEDNLKFKNEVLNKIPLSPSQKRDFRFKMNYILCGGHYKRKNWVKFITYFTLTALVNPIKFLKQRY